MTSPPVQKKGGQRKSLVSPFLAFLVSIFGPGVGHVLAGVFARGLLLFLSFATIIGLLIWRINEIARREILFSDKAVKAFRLEPVLAGLVFLTLLLWLWIAIDAYRVAKRGTRGSTILFVIVLIVFFGLGWLIGEVDMYRLATEVSEAGPRLVQIMWPWERAISREEQMLIGEATIQVPCTDQPPPVPPEEPGMPRIIPDPTCGLLSEQDGTPGTLLQLAGSGFLANTPTEIWWADPLNNEFRQRREGEYLIVTTDGNGEFQTDLIMPYRLVPASAQGAQTWTLQARQVGMEGKAQASTEIKLVVTKMVETIFLGMMATFFGIIFALPISFLAARNLMSANRLTLAVYYATRTVLNIVRSIEPLIWAVIAVSVVGLGPFAGIVALTLHTIAALGKLYSEAIESIDPGPIEAIHATGATWLQTVVYAVVPQIVPPFVSFTIYRWDINIRMSTIIGLVGGGGIGFLLVQWMRLLDFKAAGLAVWFIVITVATLDFVSAEIRQRFV
jgi:phosphonate transport system permease protein